MYHIALMQGTVKDADFKHDRVIGRQWVLHRQGVVHRAADGLGFLRVSQPLEAGIEGYRIVKHQRIFGTGGHMRTQQWRLHKLPVDAFQVIHHHIIIMGIVETERRHGIGFVKAKVAITISIGEKKDALATESAVGIEQISKTLILDPWLNGILHRLLAGDHRQNQKKQTD